MTSTPMNIIDTLISRFRGTGDLPALAWRGELTSFAELADRIEELEQSLETSGIRAGDTVVLVADYSVSSVALVIALTRLRTVIVPVLPPALKRMTPQLEKTDPSWTIEVDDTGGLSIKHWNEGRNTHELIDRVRARTAAGLVLFTSGSSGKPKGVVHNFSQLLEKFRVRRPALVTLNFLLFDHWGGLNTLFHGLSNQSLVVLPENRTPDSICHLLEQHNVELLPATPTFLNMLLISQAWKGRKFPCLRIISYGAEPMPASTLAGLRQAFPSVELRQTYGLIELGVLRAKSKDNDSLWVKLGGKGYDLRVVDDILQIKADAAMLGYIDADSPFTEDGYFITGDRVEVDGDYFRILGRASDLINVGGEKVFPAEVETVLLSCSNVRDAVVYGEAHPMMGRIVCAEVMLVEDEPEKEVRVRLKKACREKLEGYKVPVKIKVVSDGLYSDRMKKVRTR